MANDLKIVRKSAGIARQSTLVRSGHLPLIKGKKITVDRLADIEDGLYPISDAEYQEIVRAICACRADLNRKLEAVAT